MGILLAAPRLRVLFFPKVPTGLLVLGIAPLPFLLLADSLSAALLSSGREALYARTLWLRTIATAVVLASSLFWQDRLAWILVGRLIVNALVTLRLAVATAARPHWAGLIPVAAKAIRYGMPIAIGGSFVALHRRADVFVLSALGRTGEIGGYALCYALAESFWLITDSLEAALFLELTRQDDRTAASAAWRAFRTYWAIGLAAALGGLLAGEGLLRTVFRSRYGGAASFFPWILLAAIAWGVARPLSSYLYSRERTKTVMACHAAGLVLNLSLCLATIPRWGATGAAVASLASYTFEGLLITLIFQRQRIRVEVARGS